MSKLKKLLFLSVAFILILNNINFAVTTTTPSDDEDDEILNSANSNTSNDIDDDEDDNSTSNTSSGNRINNQVSTNARSTCWSFVNIPFYCNFN